MSKVNIIMNCFNGAEYLKLSLDSVFAQTHTNWDIIFIDNCSTDTSAEIAKSYGGKVRYYKTDSNIPLYAARNIALNYIDGDYVAFLDVDDLWLYDKLEKQIKLFSDPEVGFVFTGVEYIDSQGNKLENEHPKLKRGKITQALLLRNFIAMSSSMVLATVFQKYRFVDEYNLLGDYDFWLRISTCYGADFIPDKLFLSRLHLGSTTNKNKGKWIIEMRKHYFYLFREYRLKYANIFIYILKCEIGNLIRRY